ncbi:MAG: peptide chain release factor N(5)-glutamine methyltransferase [Pseudomonadales bacterium]|nr:peptide chain release factor N(5)-glutamine methyltransferase [Pseudomonadales bacterium]
MTRISDVLSNISTSIERRDAELLLAFVLEKSDAFIYAHSEHKLTQTQIEELDILVRRRAKQEPIAYLLGEKGFFNLDLNVSEHVLIPRPETELLVEYALEHVGSSGSILDLGTGSGAIALALASHAESTYQVSASDVCHKALKVAKRNASLHQLTVTFILSDWFDAIDSRYSAILCNPPYIAESDTEVEQSVFDYEPHRALFAGADGLDAIRQIIGQAPQYLLAKGVLALEHGWQQATQVSQLFLDNGYTDIITLNDLAGIQRVTLARAGV